MGPNDDEGAMPVVMELEEEEEDKEDEEEDEEEPRATPPMPTTNGVVSGCTNDGC